MPHGFVPTAVASPIADTSDFFELQCVHPLTLSIFDIPSLPQVMIRGSKVINGQALKHSSSLHWGYGKFLANFFLGPLGPGDSTSDSDEDKVPGIPSTLPRFKNPIYV